MQSINAGFQSLRTLLPHHEGEKLSKAAILQQTAEYIYQLEQEKTRLLSQNSQLKRLYSLSQQGLTSPGSGGQSGGQSGGGSDDTTSPRLKKKRLISSNTSNTTNVTTSLEYTSEMLKAESEAVAPSSGGEMYQTSANQQNQSSNSNSTSSNSNTQQPQNNTAAPSVAELSLQLMNEQRLRMRLEERLKTLEQHAASSIAPNTTNTNVVTTAKAPVPVAVLPTQPLKMEVVNPVGNSKVLTEQQISIKPTGIQPGQTGGRPSLPGTILLADKNGIRVEVEAVAGLPQTPVAVSLQPATPTAVQVAAPAPVSEVVVAAGPASITSIAQAGKGTAGNSTAGALPAEELKTTNNVVTTTHPAASRSYIVTTGPPVGGSGTPGAVSGPPGTTPNTRQNLDSIVEAIRHLEGDHLFSEDSHKVVKEEVVEYSTPIQVQATNLSSSSQHHHVTVTKNLVPSKIVGLKPVVSTSTMVTTNPIPATLLPTQPHPPSAVLHQQNSARPTTVTKSESNSIIIVKSCQA